MCYYCNIILCSNIDSYIYCIRALYEPPYLRSKNSIRYYVVESFRKPNGTTSSRNVFKLGTEAELREKLGEGVDIKAWCQQEVKKLNAAAKAKKPLPIQLSIIPNVPYAQGQQRSFNVGYLILQKYLYELGIADIAREIKTRNSFKFNLEKILSDFVYARILEPGSKRSSLEFCSSELLEEPDYELHDVYRALDVICEENDLIQSSLYKNSARVCKRDTAVVFYDCTNFYFEITEESGMRRYGHSKENRPNPIVQMGMFIDSSGIPLGFEVFNGNKSEQLSLRPLEKKILSDFDLPDRRLIVCTDAGLASIDNKMFNAKSHLIKDSLKSVKTDFITIQPLKKLAEKEREWALNHGALLRTSH